MAQWQRSGSRALDVLHKMAATGVIAGTCYIGYDLASRFYAIRQRRIQWEREHPEYVQEFYEKKKLDKETEKAMRDEEKRIKTEQLLTLIQQQEKEKSLHQQSEIRTA